MPHYSLKSTTIKLMTWDPEKPMLESDPKTDNFSSSPMTRGGLTPNTSLNARYSDQYNASSSFPPKPNLNTRYNDQYNASKDPSEGFEAVPLSESYFNSEFPGIDFLGSYGSYPFYLINAAKELLNTRDNGSSGKDTLCRSTAYGINAAKDDEVSKTYLDDGNESSADATMNRPDSLSSLSGPSSSHMHDVTVAVAEDRELSRVRTRASSAKREASASLELESTSRSKRRRLKPIKLVFELPERAYVPSLVTNKPFDLCINIYYNGQLTASRIVKSHCHPSERDLQYSGRRLQTEVELPWAIVLPEQSSFCSAGADDSLVKSGHTVADRWNQINKLLAEDAGSWEKHDKCRSPMCEYLEELSNLSIPYSLKNAGGEAYSRMGIIDVAIAMGHSIPLHSISRTLLAPRHKISEDKIGKNRILVTVPKEGKAAGKNSIQTEAKSQLRAKPKRNAKSKLNQKKQSKEEDEHGLQISKALVDFVPVISDSVLTFPTADEAWSGLEIKNGVPLRKIRKEREAVFRAEDILVGVRYVLGS